MLAGNLENNSTMKSLEEINYFDGDANAVTADLVNNVDVSRKKMVLVPGFLTFWLNFEMS